MLRSLTALAVAGALAIGVFTPVTSHAAGMTKFNSKVCPYSLSYPAGWSVSTKGHADTFSKGRVIIVVSCGSNKLPPSTFISTFINALKSSGYTISNLKTKGGFATFQGHKGAVYFDDGLVVNSKSYVLLQAVAATKADMDANEAVLTQIGNTVRIH